MATQFLWPHVADVRLSGFMVYDRQESTKPKQEQQKQQQEEHENEHEHEEQTISKTTCQKAPATTTPKLVLFCFLCSPLSLLCESPDFFSF